MLEHIIKNIITTTGLTGIIMWLLALCIHVASSLSPSNHLSHLNSVFTSTHTGPQCFFLETLMCCNGRWADNPIKPTREDQLFGCNTYLTDTFWCIYCNSIMTKYVKAGKSVEEQSRAGRGCAGRRRTGLISSLMLLPAWVRGRSTFKYDTTITCWCFTILALCCASGLFANKL